MPHGSALPSFPWVNSIPLCGSAAFYYAFIVDGHLGYFHLVAIVNRAAMDIFVQVSVGIPVFKSLGYIPRSGVVLYTIWGKHHTVFHRGCTILHSHEQCARVPVSPPPHHHVISASFLIQPRGCEGVSHCGFYLRVSDG